MAGYGGQSPLSQQYWYVYILKCKDGSIYTGCTNNLEDRLKRHNLGQVLATINILPAEIITYIAFTDKYKAYAFERYLKKGPEEPFQKGIYTNNVRLFCFVCRRARSLSAVAQAKAEAQPGPQLIANHLE